MTNRKLQYWVIPPKCDAEFVANMEDVLRIYEKPYDPAVPVLCMDEQPVQLIKETKVPIPATKSKPVRIDYEYERAGVANVFMFAEPQPVGGKSMSASIKRRSTGQRKWPRFSKVAMKHASE